MKTVAVVNPHSAGGKTGRRLPEIVRALEGSHRDVTVATTGGPLHAERLTREALLDGAERVIAVGGDGTIGEVVNGFFVDRVAVNAAAEFAMLELGTGGDFRRSFSIPDRLEEGVRRIIEGESSPIDVGVVKFTTPLGARERCFVNVASIGMSAEVATQVNRRPWLKQRAGALAFGWGAAAAILRRPRYQVCLTLDGGRTEALEVAMCAVCNGRYVGGGMHIAPNARPADGLLEVVAMDAMSRLALLNALRLVYSGRHLDLPGVRQYRACALRVEPLDATASIPVELDGDTPGVSLPADFAILPRALLFRR